jgi:hypothetical protein
MKITIRDGCANGGMMDSLSIYPAEDEDDVTCEVAEEAWREWQAFLKQHNKWERFWDTKLR